MEQTYKVGFKHHFTPYFGYVFEKNADSKKNNEIYSYRFDDVKTEIRFQKMEHENEETFENLYALKQKLKINYQIK